MRTFRKLTTMFLVILTLLSLTGCGRGGNNDPPETSDTIYAVIIKQLDHPSLNEISDAIESRLNEISQEKGTAIKVDVLSGQNDPTVLKQLAEQSIAKEADVIIPIATMAAQVTAASAEGTGIPVVFAAVSDPEGAGLTGLKDVTGTCDAFSSEDILDIISTLQPDIKKIGLLYSLSEVNSTKAITTMKDLLSKLGIEYTEATADTPDEVVAAVSLLISANTEAVFTPTDNVIAASELAIYEDLREAGIPHYVGADSFVRNGAFLTISVNYTDLGKITAEMAYDIVAGTYTQIGAYLTVSGNDITVNTETAAAVGIDYSTLSSYTSARIIEVTTSED